MSVFIARDPGGYLTGMTRFRLGELDPWVDWLAAEIRYSSEATQDLSELTEQLLVEWGRRVGDLRADATARRVLSILIEHPVVSSDLVAARVEVSERAGRAALRGRRSLITTLSRTQADSLAVIRRAPDADLPHQN